MLRVTTFIMLLLMAPTGYAAVWGKPYKVEFANSSSITINFDPGLTNMGEIQHVAQEHCAKFEKDTLPQTQSHSPWGLSTFSFVCNKRT